jgi:hypothetical protein
MAGAACAAGVVPGTGVLVGAGAPETGVLVGAGAPGTGVLVGAVGGVAVTVGTPVIVGVAVGRGTVWFNSRA